MSGAATLGPATAPQDEGRTAWETPAQVGGKGFLVLCLVWRYLLPLGLDRCYACPGMGIGDALVGPAATSSIQFVGQGYPFGMRPPGRSAPCASVGWGLPAETRASITPTPQQCPSREPSGERDAQSFWSIHRGRPFGELGSILCGLSRVQGRDPPVFSARITGKSLNT